MYPVSENSNQLVELATLGELFAEYDGPRIALESMRRGHNGKLEFMRRINERASNNTIAGAADRLLGFDSTKEGSSYSITRAIRAAADRDWKKASLERDVSNMATTKTGKVPNGFFIPLGVLANGVGKRDFNVGTATEAGNLVGAGKDQGALTRDPLRRNMPLARMGATILSGLSSTLSIPFFSSATTASWNAEIGAATSIAETTTNVTLTPQRCAVQMTVSRQAIFQSEIALDQVISRQLTTAVLEQVGHGAINGDGTSNSPVGIRSTSGIGNIAGGTNGAQIAFTHLASLENAPTAANAPETPINGFLVNAATRRWLRTVNAGTGLPYVWENTNTPLLGHPVEITNLLPSNLVKNASGAVCSSLIYSNDWSALIIGIYGGGIDVLVDRITQASTGKLIITASIEVGVGVTNPSAFAKMDDGLTA